MLRRTTINFVNKTLEKNSSWKILDIGCGYRANKYATVIADIQDFSNFYKEKKFVHLEGKDLPFKDKEFDFVIASHVIEHVENPDHALLEFKRIIKNKGKIFLFIPNDGSKLCNIIS